MFEETQLPKQLPSETHHVIVDLENSTIKTPQFDTSPLTHETISYEMQSADDDFRDKVKFASIVITTITPINAKSLGEAPYLKLVVGRTTGTDHIDLDECKRRGITVLNTPGATVEAVSEHALALYFAARKRIPWHQNALYDFEDGRPNLWKVKNSMSFSSRTSEGKPTPTCEQEVVGMIGIGTIGQRIALLCRVLGMKVLVAERKGESGLKSKDMPSIGPAGNGVAGSSLAESGLTESGLTGDGLTENGITANGITRNSTTANGITRNSTTDNGINNNGNSSTHAEGRVPFEEVLRQATVVILALPLTAESHDLISDAELALMRPDAVIVNISRGKIVNEKAVVKALREGRVYGYGTDVFETDPAGSDADSVLLNAEARGLNLALTPHLAWYGDKTFVNVVEGVTRNVEQWVRGKADNVVV